MPTDRADFNIPRWFAEWITIPQPSLGGRKPEDILDTPTGRALVKQVVGAKQSLILEVSSAIVPEEPILLINASPPAPFG